MPGRFTTYIPVSFHMSDEQPPPTRLRTASTSRRVPDLSPPTPWPMAFQMNTRFSLGCYAWNHFVGLGTTQMVCFQLRKTNSVSPRATPAKSW